MVKHAFIHFLTVKNRLTTGEALQIGVAEKTWYVLSVEVEWRPEMGIFQAVLHDVTCRLMTCERIKNNQNRVIYCMWQVLFRVFL